MGGWQVHRVLKNKTSNETSFNNNSGLKMENNMKTVVGFLFSTETQIMDRLQSVFKSKVASTTGSDIAIGLTSPRTRLSPSCQQCKRLDKMLR